MRWLNVNLNIGFSRKSILTRIHFPGKNMDRHLVSPWSIYCQHFLGRKKSKVILLLHKGTQNEVLSDDYEETQLDTEKLLPRVGKTTWGYISDLNFV